MYDREPTWIDHLIGASFGPMIFFMVILITSIAKGDSPPQAPQGRLPQAPPGRTSLTASTDKCRCGIKNCKCGCADGEDCTCAANEEYEWDKERKDSPGNLPLYRWESIPKGTEYPKTRIFYGEWRPFTKTFHKWVKKPESRLGYDLGESCNCPVKVPTNFKPKFQCGCSPSCTCGCNEGYPCQCDKPKATPQPAWHLRPRELMQAVQPMQQYVPQPQYQQQYQPQQQAQPYWQYNPQVYRPATGGNYGGYGRGRSSARSGSC